MEAIYNFDLKVFNFISSNLWSSWLNEVMKVITRLCDGGILWIVIAGILLLTKKYRKCGIIMAVGLLCSGIINNLILKELIARPRPFNYEAWKPFFVYPEIIKRPSSFSFPSGHTTASICSAFVLFRENKKFGIPAFILAILIAFSRIYLHVHYTTDILAGIVLGIVYGLLAVLIVEKLVPLIIKLFKKLRVRFIKRSRKIRGKKSN